MVSVRVSEFKALVIKPEDDLCERLKKTFIRLPILLYKLMSYMFASDGTFSAQFASDICAIPCTPDPTTQ